MSFAIALHLLLGGNIRRETAVTTQSQCKIYWISHNQLLSTTATTYAIQSPEERPKEMSKLSEQKVPS